MKISWEKYSREKKMNEVYEMFLFMFSQSLVMQLL